MAPIAYISFDVVPAPKGAAVHIAAFTRSLAAHFGDVDLVTVAPPEPLGRLTAPGLRQTTLPAIGPTLIHRVLHFRAQLRQWLQGQHFQAIHIRSIYEGWPIAQRKATYCDRLIFEVNGLPSIELKYKYPDVVDDLELLHKLTAQEQVCLDAADRILTPSHVTQAHLIRRGVPPAKISVIPNGVDLSHFPYRAPLSPPTGTDPLRLLYFGTLSAWQGVDLAIRALPLLDFPAVLTLVGTATKRQRRALDKLAGKLGVAAQVHLQAPTTQADLVTQLHQSHATLAPLTVNDRNVVQGCCPLKVLEGMATGTPVIASDLPVVRELGQPHHHFLPVKAGSVPAIAQAVTRLRTNPDLGPRLAQAARQHIEQHFTWAQSGTALIQIYRDLGVRLP